jgi:hypothetical protein
MSSTRGRPAADPQQAGYPQAGYPPQTSYPQTEGYPASGERVTYSGGGGAKAGTMLGGILMIFAGVISFLAGLAMVTKTAFFHFPAGYAYNWTTHGWGWTQLIIGAVVFAAGVCVMLGMTWARIVGVILATLSAISSFLVLPYYPIWSVILIAVDLFVIWALVARGRHVQRY